MKTHVKIPTIVRPSYKNSLKSENKYNLDIAFPTLSLFLFILFVFFLAHSKKGKEGGRGIKKRSTNNRVNSKKKKKKKLSPY